MTVIVNTGSTLTVQIETGLTLTSDSTVASGGFLDGDGVVTGAFNLVDQGTIAADLAGTTLSLNMGTLTNQGTVLANNATLAMASSAALTNMTGGTLTGGTWDALGTGTIALSGGAIVTDNATIILDGTSSLLTGYQSGAVAIDNSLTTIANTGTLELLHGRNFTAAGSLVINGDLTLAGGTLSGENGGITVAATGTITGYGTLDQGTPISDSGLIVAAGGTLALPAAGEFSGGQGTLMAAAGATLALLGEGSQYSYTIVNDGTVAITTNQFVPGKIDITGPYSGTGSFLIEGLTPGGGARTELELPGSVSANVTFDPNAGLLLLDTPASFTGMLSGFGDADEVTMSGISTATSATLSGDLLSIQNNLGVVEQTLTLDLTSMNYTGAIFSVSENPLNNTATLSVSGSQAACYVEGTRISTLAGEVAVEKLKVGDIVRARFAGDTPVVWIGHRHIDCRRHPSPEKVWPVLVRAHAFGPRAPHRDLWLSPDHAVFVDDVLIPIRYLINKTSIRQVKVDHVTYFHVELAEHDVLLAEGLTAESYLENGDRGAFDNGGPAITLHPDFGARRWDAMGCAPLVVTGPALKAVKDRLDQRGAQKQRLTKLKRPVRAA